MNKFPFISSKCPHLLHGGDYNPDQWLDQPQILKDDLRLMRLANCNAMSVGIFSWTALEPEEGRFTFGWLDKIMDDLADNGAFAVLATPSGAKPAWLSQKYPEILRVGRYGIRNRHGMRHNHCFTSPVYREKVEIMTKALLEWETIDADQISDIIEGRPPRPPKVPQAPADSSDTPPTGAAPTNDPAAVV